MSIPEAEGKSNIQAALRAESKSILQGLDLQALSKAAQSLVLETNLIQKYKNILFYLPMADELDLQPLITTALQLSVNCFVPRVALSPDGEVLTHCTKINSPDCVTVKGPWGSPQAVGENYSLEHFPFVENLLVFVPGLFFDRSGGRLGRGKGFYDRLLASLREVNLKITAIGVCPDEIVSSKELSLSSWDQRVDCLLTQTVLVDCLR